jgi:hypothetical protein
MERGQDHDYRADTSKTILTFEGIRRCITFFNYSWAAVMILDLVANISIPIQLILLLSVPMFS